MILATFQNAKGEVIAVVRAQNAADARYQAGVHQSNTSSVLVSSPTIETTPVK